MKSAIRLLAVLCLAAMLLSFVPVRAEATEIKSGIGTVTASALRLRSAPSSDARILSTASRGDKVVVLRRVGDWYLVNYNLDIGYMHRDYLSVTDRENVKLGFAMFDTPCNVRLGPGTDTGVVAQAPKCETCFIIGFNCGWYKVSYNGQIGYVRSDLVTLLEKPYANSGRDPWSRGLGDPGMDYYKKLWMIYGTWSVSDHRLVYQTEAEARSHMTDVLVQTWDINGRGEKYTRYWLLTVHENIAPTVRAIFAELYALPERPPIHTLGGFRWDGKSEHSVGLAIDMNQTENFYCDPSGRALTTGWFRPDTDPYSFPIGGAVERVFRKYGFTRGIYWKNGYKDYMHFSFFGT